MRHLLLRSDVQLIASCALMWFVTSLHACGRPPAQEASLGAATQPIPSTGSDTIEPSAVDKSSDEAEYDESLGCMSPLIQCFPRATCRADGTCSEQRPPAAGEVTAFESGAFPTRREISVEGARLHFIQPEKRTLAAVEGRNFQLVIVGHRWPSVTATDDDAALQYLDASVDTTCAKGADTWAAGDADAHRVLVRLPSASASTVDLSTRLLACYRPAQIVELSPRRSAVDLDFYETLGHADQLALMAPLSLDEDRRFVIDGQTLQLADDITLENITHRSVRSDYGVLFLEKETSVVVRRVFEEPWMSAIDIDVFGFNTTITSYDVAAGAEWAYPRTLGIHNLLVFEAHEGVSTEHQLSFVEDNPAERVMFTGAPTSLSSPPIECDGRECGAIVVDIEPVDR